MLVSDYLPVFEAGSVRVSALALVALPEEEGAPVQAQMDELTVGAREESAQAVVRAVARVQARLHEA